ncbi:MAG TPA: PHB depolymerase family esterase, partial [Kofleriaceae bacterium]|nr:PHB depolymerase family esterase [Kofleriaceae bacterium]
MRRLAIALLVCTLSAPAHATLTQVTSFGSNPGALSMYEYVPANLPVGRPLVVVLHGCTQTAASMETAGWNKLADQYQFAVLYPQQSSSNNPVSCFNWAGEYGDTANLVRGQGENQSIMSMVETMHSNHGTDPTKVYIAGFSAGAAFVSVMLATWPDKFAAGAIMEGIAYRCATSVNEAYSCQSPGVTKTAAAWGDLVRGAYTSFTGTRPRVQIWVGTSDTTVVPANGTELVKQWTNVAGTDQTADETEALGSAATRTAYKMGSTTVVEQYVIQGMNHAVSVGAEGATACPGMSGSYFDAKPVCSTIRAAKFFGVMPGGSGSGSGSGSGAGGDPYVSIVSPANGDNVTGQLTIVVAAGDDAGIANVSLEIDGANAGTDMDAPYQFDWNATAAGPGTHTLAATATDSAGHSATAMATVTVPGPGGGGGSGGGSAGEKDIGDLPACSLDAGKSDGRGFAPIAI